MMCILFSFAVMRSHIYVIKMNLLSLVKWSFIYSGGRKIYEKEVLYYLTQALVRLHKKVQIWQNIVSFSRLLSQIEPLKVCLLLLNKIK